jgi:predicted NUDIX family phosphoesterase
MEKVLVAATAHLRANGLCLPGCGFIPNPMSFLEFLASPGATRFVYRDGVEQDENFRQIIPFFVVHLLDGILINERSSSKGDKRLRGKTSLLVGGHVNPEDCVAGEIYSGLNVINTIINGARRELAEELNIFSPGPVQARIAGVVSEDITEAGRTHVGLAIYLPLFENSTVYPASNDFDGELRFVPRLSLCGVHADNELVAKLETWSALTAASLDAVIWNPKQDKQPILFFSA